MEFVNYIYDLFFDNTPDIIIPVKDVEISTSDIDNLINEVKQEIEFDKLKERHYKIKIQELEERFKNLDSEEEEEDDTNNDNNNNFEKVLVTKKKLLVATTF